MNIANEILRVKEQFTRLSSVEMVDDWQGNQTTSQNRYMLVQRNVHMTLGVPKSNEILADLTKADLPWAEDHFQERISGKPTNPGDTYKYWPYHPTLETDKTVLDEKFSHTYQERFWPKNGGVRPYIGYPHLGLHFQYGDYMDVVDLLVKNPTTRQAYLPIWFPEDTWAANNGKRVPCTLGYYFYIANDRLHLNYIIRSCDMFRHFRNDLYLTCRLLQYTSELIGLPIGEVNINIFNLHLFVNDKYIFNKRENKYG